MVEQRPPASRLRHAAVRVRAYGGAGFWMIQVASKDEAVEWVKLCPNPLEGDAEIEIRQIKYLNNLVEQDHRAIKRIVRPMLGFQSFRSARITLQGVELMHMIKKGQMIMIDGQSLSAAERFYSLAA